MGLRGLHIAYFGNRQPKPVPRWWTAVTILCGPMPLSFVWRYYRAGMWRDG